VSQKASTLEEKIEDLRKKLLNSVDGYQGDLLNPETYRISQELDRLINEAMKYKLTP